MFDNKPKQNVNELALEYLEQKYGEKFEYKAPRGMSYTGSCAISASCQSLGDELVYVRIDNYNDDDKRVFHDNYIAVKYHNEISLFFENCGKSVFSSVRVFYDTSEYPFSSDLQANASVEQLLNIKEAQFVVRLAVKESEFHSREQFSDISDIVFEQCNADDLEITIIVVADEEYDLVDKNDLQDKFGTQSFVDCAVISRYDGNTSLNYYGR